MYWPRLFVLFLFLCDWNSSLLCYFVFIFYILCLINKINFEYITSMISSFWPQDLPRFNKIIK